MNAIILPMLASIFGLFMLMIRRIWLHYSASVEVQAKTLENTSVLTTDTLLPKEMFAPASAASADDEIKEPPSNSLRNEKQHSELVDDYIGDFFSKRTA